MKLITLIRQDISELKYFKYIKFIIFILIILFTLFYKLDTWPNTFLFCELEGIKFQIGYFLAGINLYKDIAWTWIDSYLHTATHSPLIWLTQLGMPYYSELNFFSIRFTTVLLNFIALLFFFCTMRRAYSTTLAFACALLLSSTPAYLSIVRSASIISIGMSLAIISTCLLYQNLKQTNWFKIILFNLVLIITSYGHVTIRPLLPVYSAIVFFYLLKNKKTLLPVFIISLSIFLSPQFSNGSMPFKNYFLAKNEAINTLEFPEQDADQKILILKNQITQNAQNIIKQIFPLNIDQVFPSLAYSWHYISSPMFFWWFSLPGLLLFILFFRKNQLCLIFLILLAAIPGLFVSKGQPGLSRIHQLIPLIVIISTFGFYHFFQFIKLRSSLQFLLLMLMVFINAYNYFIFPKENVDITTSRHHEILDAISITKDRYPHNKIIVMCNTIASYECLHAFRRLQRGHHRNIQFFWVCAPEEISAKIDINTLVLDFHSECKLGIEPRLKLSSISEEIQALDSQLLLYEVNR